MKQNQHARLLAFALVVCLVPAGGVAGSVRAARAENETLFRLGARTGQFQVWGRGADTRFYFSKWLPALFERTLVVDEMNAAGGRLEWIFTGDRGGFTVVIDDNGVGFYQRYYDSPGFSAVAQKSLRHPEWRTPRKSLAPEETPRSVSVLFDHKLRVVVRVDGREVLAEECSFDVTRQQLRLTGGDKERQQVTGRMAAPSAQAVEVVVDPSRTHQRMIGFGGIATPTAYAQLSETGQQRWWELLCEYNLLVQREYPNGLRLNEAMDNWDRLVDATPHYYGDNFPNGEISDFDYIKQLRRLGGQVWFEFWGLPPWVGKDSDKYAEAMVRYCQVSRDKAGAPPEIVGVQNEVRQTPQMWHAMTQALRTKLDEAGFGSVQIHMSDSGTLAGGIERAQAFRSSRQTWDTIDYAATHMYDYQSFFGKPDEYDARLLRWKELTDGKPFLSTELCVNNAKYQWPSYRLALTMGQLYHKNLVLGDAAAICYCWTLLNVVQPSYGWTRSLCVPDPADGFVPVASSHQLRVFGAFSRRIRAGMQRVAVRCDDHDVLVSAYAGSPASATAVLLNRSTAPKRVKVKWPGVAFAAREVVGPYQANEVVPLRPGGAGEVLLAPGEIVTLTNVPLGRFSR